MAVYDAFISYSHAQDKAIAAALQSVVQKLGKPWYRRRALRVFRDDTSLSATPQLWPSIEQALGQSRYFILLASPEAAASKWVGKEVAYWLDHSSVDTLLIGLTDGDLSWDETTGDFATQDVIALPPVLAGRFPAEPKWVDLRPCRQDSDKGSAKFTELAADFAAAIRGMPKEDLLSQEVRQQRRALTLAWSAAAGLLFLAVAAVWQWTRAVEQTNVAIQERARAEEQRQRADEQRDLAVSAQTQAERERDRARESLLVAAGRQSLLLTRDHRPEQAWTALTDVLSELNADRSTPLPAPFLEAGLTALIEDRIGPEMVLTPGERTLADRDNHTQRVAAAFDPKSDRVAAGRDFDVAIWSTRNLQQLARYQMRYPISSLAFNQAGDILIVIQESKQDGAFVTLIEPATARLRTLPLQDCLGLVNCIAERPKVPQKLVDIRQQDGLAKVLEEGSKLPALLVEPDLPIMLKRYYAIAQEDRDRITIAVLDIQTGAVARLAPKESASWRITVAKDQPLIVLSASDNNRLDVYRLEIDPRNASRLAIRPVKQLKARDSVATKDVALSDDGRLLYYSNWAGGASGGGRGAIIAAIIDVQSGVETWSDPFDGDTQYGPKQDFFARSSEGLNHSPTRSSEGVNRRPARTSFVDGRTQQEKLSVPGRFVAFDPRGEMALVQSVTTADDVSGAEAAESARLRLVELSKLTSLSNEPREPRAVRTSCRLVGRPFKTLSDRMDRLWNGNDWHRRPLAGLQGTPLDRLEHRSGFVQLQWAKDQVTVLDQDGTVLAKGAADEVTKQRPDLAEPISRHADMRLTEFSSPDGRWLAVTRATNISDEQGEVDWKLYRVTGGDRTLFKSETTTGESFYEAAVFFFEHAHVAAIRDGVCSVTLWSLEDGRKLGQISPTLSQKVRLKLVSDDIIMVYSYDDYAEVGSVQVFSYPDLHAGPWLLVWEDFGMEEVRGAAAVAPSPLIQPLSPHRGTLEIAESGRVLIVRPDPGEGEPIALSVPPWGRRLREIFERK